MSTLLLIAPPIAIATRSPIACWSLSEVKRSEVRVKSESEVQKRPQTDSPLCPLIRFGQVSNLTYDCNVREPKEWAMNAKRPYRVEVWWDGRWRFVATYPTWDKADRALDRELIVFGWDRGRIIDRREDRS